MTRINMQADATAEAGSYAPIPDGEYTLTVDEVEDGTTQSGRQKSNLTFVVADGPYQGRKIWYTLTYIPAGEPGHGFMVQALKGLGMPYDGDLDFDTAELMGRTCRAMVEQDTYEDKEGNEKQKNKIATAGFITGEPAVKSAAKPSVKPAPRSAAPKPAAPKSQEEVPF